MFVRDWLRYFPRNQIHILKLEDLSAKPEQTLQKVFRFLGVATKGWKMPAKHNANKNPMNEPTRNDTKMLLERFYDDHNKKLAQLLKDDSFLKWRK